MPDMKMISDYFDDTVPAKGRCEIQIEQQEPFEPDEVYQIGAMSGYISEAEGIKGIRLKTTTAFSFMHYKYKGQIRLGFYAVGKWVAGNDDLPRFCVSVPLTHQFDLLQKK